MSSLCEFIYRWASVALSDLQFVSDYHIPGALDRHFFRRHLNFVKFGLRQLEESRKIGKIAVARGFFAAARQLSL